MLSKFKIHKYTNGNIEVWFDTPVSDEILEKIKKEFEELDEKDMDDYYLKKVIEKVLKEECGSKKHC